MPTPQPPAPVRTDSVLAFDIGGSRIKAATDAGLLGEVPTPLHDFAAFVAALRGFLTGAERGIVLSVTGIVPPDGPAKVANIPCLDGRAVATDLGRALGLPVLVLNDADCFAMAERAHGAGRGHRNVLGLILGSGVGGGVIIDGRLVRGTGGYTGELGHGPVIRDPAFACGCGQTGCLDTVGSARGLERLHRHLTGQTLTSHAILDRWLVHPMPAVDLWLDLVSGVLSVVINVLGCSIVPVGGGLANVPRLITALDLATRDRILRRTDQPLLVVAQVSTDAGLIGALAAGKAEYAA